MKEVDFQVRTGTKEPFAIREVEQELGVDLELEARMACTTRVSGYDEKRYAGEEEVCAQVRSRVFDVAAKLHDYWPAGQSLVRNYAYRDMGGLIDAYLHLDGIVAETEITDFQLTEESHKRYVEAMPPISEMMGQVDDLPGMLPSSWDQAAPAKMDIPKGPDFCPNCGEKRVGGVRFCPECGALYQQGAE